MQWCRKAFSVLLLTLSCGLARAGTATDLSGLEYTGTYPDGTLLPSTGTATDSSWIVTYANVAGQNYSGNSQYTGASYVINNSPYITSENYVQNTSTAQWITAPGATTTSSGTVTNSGGNYLPGNGTSGTNSAEFIYTMTFSIEGTGHKVDNNVQISLTIAADDDYAIYVNPTVNSNGSISSLSSASATGTNSWTNSTVNYLQNYTSGTNSSNSSFLIGVNTISIVITNSNEITGSTTSNTLNPSGLLVYEVGSEAIIDGKPVPEVGAWLPLIGALGLYGVLAWRQRRIIAGEVSAGKV